MKGEVWLYLIGGVLLASLLLREAQLFVVALILLLSVNLFAGSALAREAFGEAIVAHYLNNAKVELAAFESTVTDWERARGFERL